MPRRGGVEHHGGVVHALHLCCDGGRLVVGCERRRRINDEAVRGLVGGKDVVSIVGRAGGGGGQSTCRGKATSESINHLLHELGEGDDLVDARDGGGQVL